MVTKPLKVAVLISGRGSNLQALIDHFGPVITSSPIRIVKVISNRPDAGGIERAKKAGIPTAVFDHKTFPDRVAFDATLDRAIRESGAELVVLAGFMRLLTEGFVAAWRNRMVNVHPALLPSFRGVDTHRAEGLRAFGVFLARDSQQLLPAVQTLAFEERITTPLTIAAALADGPAGQNLDPDAAATIVLYREQKVVANFAYRSGELGAEEISRVIEAVRQLVSDD